MCLFSYLHLGNDLSLSPDASCNAESVYNLGILWQYSGRYCILPRSVYFLIFKKGERSKIATFCYLKFKWGTFSCSMNPIIIHDWLCPFPTWFFSFFFFKFVQNIRINKKCMWEIFPVLDFLYLQLCYVFIYT